TYSSANWTSLQRRNFFVSSATGPSSWSHFCLTKFKAIPHTAASFSWSFLKHSTSPAVCLGSSANKAFHPLLRHNFFHWNNDASLWWYSDSNFWYSFSCRSEIALMSVWCFSYCSGSDKERVGSALSGFSRTLFRWERHSISRNIIRRESRNALPPGRQIGFQENPWSLRKARRKGSRSSATRR